VPANNGFTPSDWIALTAVVTSIGGVVLNNWLTGHSRARERAEDRREALSNQALAVAGPLRALVLDISPVLLTMFGLTDETFRTRFGEIEERWRPLREGLVGLEVAHHSETVRRLSAELGTAVHSTIYATSAFARDLLHPLGGGHDWYKGATDHYQEATEKLDEWLLALRE
jgi:hypothetical protein